MSLLWEFVKYVLEGMFKAACLLTFILLLIWLYVYLEKQNPDHPDCLIVAELPVCE